MFSRWASFVIVSLVSVVPSRPKGFPKNNLRHSHSRVFYRGNGTPLTFSSVLERWVGCKTLRDQLFFVCFGVMFFVCFVTSVQDFLAEQKVWLPIKTLWATLSKLQSTIPHCSFLGGSFTLNSDDIEGFANEQCTQQSRFCHSPIKKTRRGWSGTYRLQAPVSVVLLFPVQWLNNFL